MENSGGATLQAAARFFQAEFRLDEHVEWLNAQCLEAAERQERSSKARKQLAEETKEAKKFAQACQDAHQVFDVYSKLLKTYQTEIDTLTKRSKMAEASLGELYRSLHQAPNPGPLLQQAMANEQLVSKQKFENAKLQTELKEFESEFAQLKNQDITIRELEDRVQELQHELADKAKVEEMATELEKERLEVDEDSRRETEELRMMMERFEKEAAEQRKAADAARTELYEVKAHFEERDASRQTEIDLLQEELSNMRQASQSESEVLRLRKLGVEEEERERKRREEELSRLYSALDAARMEATKAHEAEAEAHRKREREVEETRLRGEERLQRERERVFELESALSQSSAAVDGVNLRKNEEDKAEEERLKMAASLESVIAQLRVALNEKELILEKYKNDLLKLDERLSDQNELIAKLRQAEMATGMSFGGNYLSSPTGESSASNESTSVGVVGILQEQRDRFRRRMLELEQELESLSSKEKRSRELLEKTRSENAALAERVRHLRSSSAGSNGRLVDLPMAHAGSTHAGFQAKSPLRIMLRFVSGNAVARTGLMVYVVALHFLVLASLSTNSHSRDDDGAKVASLRKID